MNSKYVIVPASKEKPLLLCTCKSCRKATYKIQIRHGDTLRQEKRKTWRRTIKNSMNRTTTYNRHIVKQKVIYFSYAMLDCLEKKHKLSVRKSPVPLVLVSEIV